jgi:hypothetical protein
MAVARAQGDPKGKNFWNPIYKTYCADTEFGLWMWALGYQIYKGVGLRVHDCQAKDTLRKTNGTDVNICQNLFKERWSKPGEFPL